MDVALSPPARGCPGRAALARPSLPRLVGMVGALAGFAYWPLALYLHGVPLLGIAPEFVVYRLGNALALLHGEPERVRPVQGFVNALVSLGVAALLEQAYGRDVVRVASIEAYAYLVLALLLLPSAAVLALAWTHPRVALWQAAVITTLALCPWYAGSVSLQLLVAPDYWILEYGYALGTALLVIVLPAHPRPRTAALLGVWLAFGVLTKAPACGSAVLLLLVARPCSARAWAALLLAGLLTVGAVLLVYARLDIGQAVAMARFWLLFLQQPNASQQFASTADLLDQRPNIAVWLAAFGAALVLAVLGHAPWRVVLGALCWVAPYAYLLAHRLHDTSVTSLILALLGATAVLLVAVRRPVARPLAVAGAIVLVAGIGWRFDQAPRRAFDGWIADAPRQRELWAEVDAFTVAERGLPRHVWLLPSLDWAGGMLAPQLGWGGLNLAGYPDAATADGRPRWTGRTLSALMGDVVFVDDQPSLLAEAARQYAEEGAALVWVDGPATLAPSPARDWLEQAVLARPHHDRPFAADGGRVVVHVVTLRRRHRSNWPRRGWSWSRHHRP